MGFVEKNISIPAFGADQDDLIALKRRRPDLWELPLTCGNTNDLVSYLEIANEVFATFIARARSQADAPVDTFAFIANEASTCLAPFSLPLANLRLLLGHFGLKLFDLFALFRSDPQHYREKMNLSTEEWNLLALPEGQEAIRKRFGGYEQFDLFKVEAVLRYTRISRDDLEEILQVTFSDTFKQVVILLDFNKESETGPATPGRTRPGRQ